MVIRNLNFCIFAECAHLDGEECGIPACPFSPKLIKWWEWNLVQGAAISSVPPEGKKGVMNIYYDPELGEYVIERED